MRVVAVPLDSVALAPARGRMALPLAAGTPEASADGASVHAWDELVGPDRGWLDQVAADWAVWGGFDDERRPWVLTVFGLGHQLTHVTVAHLPLAERVLDLRAKWIRLRHTGVGCVRAAGLVLDDPAPAWIGERDEMAACWWDQVRTAVEPLIRQAAEHGVREHIGWGEPVGLAAVACRTLAEAGVVAHGSSPRSSPL